MATWSMMREMGRLCRADDGGAGVCVLPGNHEGPHRTPKGREFALPSPHGGKREGAGRPSTFSPNAQRLSITIEPEHAEYLRKLGGSVSLGLRKLLADKKSSRQR
jgi:hypothetical protein